MPKMNRRIVVVGTAAQTIGRQTKQAVGRVADAVLVTHAVVVVAVLAAVARYLL